MRITKIYVKGLFGMFDHEIPLNQESRITIVHGPNGVGKTVLMRMAHGLLRGDYELLSSTPFEKIKVEFEKGEFFTVEKYEEQNWFAIDFYDGTGSRYETFAPVVLDRFDLINVVKQHIPDLGLVMKRGEPFWMSRDKLRVHSDKYFYVDDAERSLLDRAGLFEWWYQLPFYEDKYPTCPFSEMPDWFRTIRNRFRTTLIETQRLLSDQGEGKLIVFSTAFEYADAFWVIDTEPTVRTLLQYIKGKLDEEFRLAHVEQDQSKLSEVQKASLIFFDIVNERILFKFLRLKDDNSEFELVDDNYRSVPPSVLSSGEQQLLVLYYKLLFDIEPDTLAMIDEPELSMNVVWQRNFLKDLQRIIELCKFDVLIATHSPEVIYDKWDWTVALGEKADD